MLQGRVGFHSDFGGMKHNEGLKCNPDAWFFREFPFNPTYG